jgi:hypothetical protein
MTYDVMGELFTVELHLEKPKNGIELENPR